MIAFLAISLFACSNEADFTGEAPSIDSGKEVFTFAGGAQGDVTFEHKTHATYVDNNCLECHTHLDVRDDTVWGCDSCHSSEDREQFCANDANGHDCTYFLCEQCHALEIPNPTPSCAGCHIPIYTGVFASGPVQGLEFSTETQDGTTDATGAYTYLGGETITFYLEDVTLGSVTPSTVMTPVDLVAGASDAYNTTVTNITRFLMTLDQDGDHYNGIVIPNAALAYMSGISIDFTQSLAAFESDTALLDLIDALNLAGVFSDGPHTLEVQTYAQSELQDFLDNLYPRAVVTSAIINGVLNTNFLLEGIYNAAAGAGWTFKWYRANDDVGTNEVEISGETTTLYQPGAADIGKYVAFEAKPLVADILRSDYEGPVDGSSTITIFGTIDAQTEVDEFTFRLDSSGTVIMNVLSVEHNDWLYYYHAKWGMGYPDCGGCHDMGGPSDLGFPEGGPSNGSSNDDLVTNLFIFNTSGVFVDSRTGVTPGSTAPGAWTNSPAPGHNGRNPYISNTLTPDDYVVKIGAALLSRADALSGTNTDGYYATNDADAYSAAQNLNNYKIEFTFP